MAVVVLSLFDHRALLTARHRLDERRRQRERAEAAFVEALANEAEAAAVLEALKTPPPSGSAVTSDEPGSPVVA